MDHGRCARGARGRGSASRLTPTYDPFARGPFPVGVRTETVVDTARAARALDVELWYPAAARHAGHDLAAGTRDTFVAPPDTASLSQSAVREAAPRGGALPLVVYSHTSGGHRRQASILCTHLASHGYVVAAADHTGSTAMDRATRATREWTDAEVDVLVKGWIADRVPDIALVVDHLVEGRSPIGRVDPARIGVAGCSFGGWAALASPERDGRVRAVLAMAPAGSSRPLPGIIPAKLTFDWGRDAATLILAGDRDEFTPLDGIEEIFTRLPATKQMVVLRDAGHGHFGDVVDEGPGLCPAESAHDFVRGLGLAHMDAFLGDVPAARQLLAGDLVALLAGRGVRVTQRGQDPAATGV